MFGIKIRKKQNIKRYNVLLGVPTKYGFEDILASSKTKKNFPENYLKKHPETEKLLTTTTFERIRMVLEELGPSYVKMGQILSNRENLLPIELIKEIEKLQGPPAI